MKRIIIISVQNIKHKNLMAILLLVLPNSTILDPSNQRLALALRWNHLTDDPYWSCLGKQSLFLIQALMNCIPVKFQRSKWRHLLSNSQTQERELLIKESCKYWKTTERRCSCVAGQGLFFSPERHNSNECSFASFILFHVCRWLGVCCCRAVPTQ